MLLKYFTTFLGKTFFFGSYLKFPLIKICYGWKKNIMFFLKHFFESLKFEKGTQFTSNTEVQL